LRILDWGGETEIETGTENERRRSRIKDRKDWKTGQGQGKDRDKNSGRWILDYGSTYHNLRYMRLHYCPNVEVEMG